LLIDLTEIEFFCEKMEITGEIWLFVHLYAVLLLRFILEIAGNLLFGQSILEFMRLRRFQQVNYTITANIIVFGSVHAIFFWPVLLQTYFKYIIYAFISVLYVNVTRETQSVCQLIELHKLRLNPTAQCAIVTAQTYAIYIYILAVANARGFIYSGILHILIKHML
jgi:hypothetical protein